jgi:hypothetical protein
MLRAVSRRCGQNDLRDPRLRSDSFKARAHGAPMALKLAHSILSGEREAHATQWSAQAPFGSHPSPKAQRPKVISMQR